MVAGGARLPYPAGVRGGAARHCAGGDAQEAGLKGVIDRICKGILDPLCCFDGE